MIQKIFLPANTYPNTNVRAIPLTQGDIFYTTDINVNSKVGDFYKDYPAQISRIDYAPKKWYQFWKKKTPIGAHIIWIGD